MIKNVFSKVTLIFDHQRRTFVPKLKKIVLDQASLQLLLQHAKAHFQLRQCCFQRETFSLKTPFLVFTSLYNQCVITSKPVLLLQRVLIYYAPASCSISYFPYNFTGYKQYTVNYYLSCNVDQSLFQLISFLTVFLLQDLPFGYYTTQVNIQHKRVDVSLVLIRLMLRG